jgi:hypothetical protein
MPRRRPERRSPMSGVASSEYLLLAGMTLLLAIIIGRVWGPEITRATGGFARKVGCTLAGNGLSSCSPEALAAAARRDTGAAAPDAAGGKAASAPSDATGGSGTGQATSPSAAGAPAGTAAATGSGAATEPAKAGDTGAAGGTPPEGASPGQAGGNRARGNTPAQTGGGGGLASRLSLTTVLIVVLVGLILLWLVARRRG